MKGGVMALVPLLQSTEFAEADQATLAAGQQAYGKVLNTWAAIGQSPGLFAAYLPFLRQVNAPGELEVRIKELVAVRVAVLNHCLYTASHRCTSAQRNGITEDELIAIARGDFGSFDARERLALELADAMTTAVPATPRSDSASGVPQALLDRAATTLAPGELVELTMSVSVWNALSRFHRVMAFDLDMPEPPAEVAALL
jgi:AhpD family alkylhydroperoxidase